MLQCGAGGYVGKVPGGTPIAVSRAAMAPLAGGASVSISLSCLFPVQVFALQNCP